MRQYSTEALLRRAESAFAETRMCLKEIQANLQRFAEIRGTSTWAGGGRPSARRESGLDLPWPICQHHDTTRSPKKYPIYLLSLFALLPDDQAAGVPSMLPGRERYSTVGVCDPSLGRVSLQGKDAPCCRDVYTNRSLSPVAVDPPPSGLI